MDAAGIGFGNKSDPYVIVRSTCLRIQNVDLSRSNVDIVNHRVGGEEQKTKALSGKLNPEFKKDSSTFTFDVRHKN